MRVTRRRVELAVTAVLLGLGLLVTVHIGPESRRRLGDGFVVEDLGEQRLKNVEEPVRVFRVVDRGSGRPVSVRAPDATSGSGPGAAVNS